MPGRVFQESWEVNVLGSRRSHWPVLLADLSFRRDDLDLKSKIGVEIYVLKFINIEVVCPMQQKMIPV